MLCVALTGGIGSGKTSVAHMFADLGVNVIDADEIAHELTANNQPGFQAILKCFGNEILTNQGDLDRKKLKKWIFADKIKKQQLENILHPLILEEMQKRIQAQQNHYCIVVIPLLREINQQLNFIHRVCVVDAPEEKRILWASQRDQTSVQEIELIIKNQAAKEERLSIADDVIENNGPLSHLKQQVMGLHQKYLQL